MVVSKYHPHGLTLNSEQMKSLGKGEKVRMKPAQLQGDMTVLLTATQIRKIQKAIAGGKGMELRLSQAQLKHIAKSGGGGFADFLKNLWSGTVHYATKPLEALIHRYNPFFGDEGSRYITDDIRQLLGAKGDPTLFRPPPSNYNPDDYDQSQVDRVERQRVGGGTYVPAYTNKRNSLSVAERRAGLEKIRQADAQDRQNKVPMTTARYYAKQRELHKYY